MIATEDLWHLFANPTVRLELWQETGFKAGGSYWRAAVTAWPRRQRPKLAGGCRNSRQRGHAPKQKTGASDSLRGRRIRPL
jgi:hypothetical protein